MIVRERDAKHGSGKHHHDGALQFDGSFGIHDVDLWRCEQRGPETFGAGCAINSGSIGGCPQTSGCHHGHRRENEDVLRADALR
jgi:hypothetical protein